MCFYTCDIMSSYDKYSYFTFNCVCFAVLPFHRFFFVCFVFVLNKICLFFFLLFFAVCSFFSGLIDKKESRVERRF